MFFTTLGKEGDRFSKAFVYLNLVSVSLFLVLYFIKVTRDVSMPWIVVCIPLIVLCLFFMVMLFLGGRTPMWRDRKWIDRAIGSVGLVLFSLFLLFGFLKKDKLFPWSWYTVLIPLFILKGLLTMAPLLLTIFQCWRCRRRTRWSRQVKTFCMIATGLVILVYVPLLTLAILLAHQEEDLVDQEDRHYKKIFIPLFLLEGFMCVGCIILDGVATLSAND